MNAYTRHTQHVAKLRRAARIIELAAILISAAAYVAAKCAGWAVARRAGL